jgi:hypothetical protein
LAVLIVTRFFVGCEAALSNGLALTEAEYVAALGSPPAEPPHIVVEAQ